jgi:c(7)-type cytochrome triheme protein
LEKFMHGKKDRHVKTLVMLVAVFAVMMFIGTAMAVPPGKTVDWDTSAGKVVFDGKIHADKGLKCNDCHTKIFKMKKGADEMKMADINAGKFCGECHNGTKVFKASDSANCVKCHKK